MQYQHIGYRIKGFYRLYDYAIKYGMDNEIAKHRHKALIFWERHGIEATMDAFDVGRRTLYNWKGKLSTGGIAALAPISSAPKCRRCRQWDKRIIDEIRQLRSQRPNLGKDKIYPLLKKYCKDISIECPSVSTIGRIISDAPDKMRNSPLKLDPKGKIKPYKRRAVTRKPKGFKSSYPGECAGLDTIEKRMYGLKRYVMTFIDPVTSFAFAAGMKKNNSTNAAKLFGSAQGCYPYPIKTALSDNGSEFKGEFAKMLIKLK